jgi:hypothetical protein
MSEAGLVVISSVGSAEFGAVVCPSAFCSRVGADRILSSSERQLNRLDRLPRELVTIQANAATDGDSSSDADVDIHGVEAESDLKSPRGTPSRRNKEPEDTRNP